METKLEQKLWSYIVENNPDLMINLQQDASVISYIKEKVEAIMPMAEQLLNVGVSHFEIEATCLEAMTEDLKPSRFLYLKSVLEEEFQQDYEQLKEEGILTYEVINLMESCKEIFEAFGFTKENEDNRQLRHAIIGQVHDDLL